MFGQTAAGGVKSTPGAITGQEAATMPGSHQREGSGAAEEIGNQIAGIGRGQNDPLDECFGFLGWVAGPLVVQTGHDREIPPILRDFTAFQVRDFSETGFDGRTRRS